MDIQYEEKTNGDGEYRVQKEETKKKKIKTEGTHQEKSYGEIPHFVKLRNVSTSIDIKPECENVK